MKKISKPLTSLLAGILLIGLSSCNLASTEKNSLGERLPESPQSETSTPNPKSNQSQSLKANQPNTVTVNVYHADSQCQTLVPETVAVPDDNSIEAAIAKVLEYKNTTDFELAGYRINVNSQNGVATLDLRVAPDSPRQFVSLSSCEKFALFGSLQKTLTDNTQWDIKEVIFTEKGEEILL
ncbi:MAG: hypothetical protein SAL07_23940 [Oscillatoria sp. PMC 1051.18]|uniref:sporulation/spore germination protein n=1 Tax=Oscillatoria salina TaxID=331517 RepID=UPI0013B6563D|nr:sporulation/spore germination protein [Oscillatoria salina]MBZ8178999.1 GerMN domain-containing protein [Oscillatoria salina IIICB1]MEC4893958.1 hypothetical protein [Oscillatoria sp. PMC 1050.18]MEC5032964.1 hypothetical protein [Oscillatoria sp. PMC 1051.18]NET88151.1 GerMN domain-containing protein [Kamptonema sp. SIO1D9]